jgi:HSP20 family protein
MCKLTSVFNEAKKTASPRSRRRSDSRWVPNTDAYLNENGLVIKVELAGLRREDLELTVDGSTLRIAGQRTDGCRTGQCTFLAMEIHYGAFETLIEVPEGFDLTRAKASYLNGFLRVDIPVAAPAKAAAQGAARTVTIQRG